MAFVGLDKLAGKTQRVELLQDQKIKGVSLASGDTVDLPEGEAKHLKNIQRVRYVDVEESTKPVRAAR